MFRRISSAYGWRMETARIGMRGIVRAHMIFGAIFAYIIVGIFCLASGAFLILCYGGMLRFAWLVGRAIIRELRGPREYTGFDLPVGYPLHEAHGYLEDD